MISLPNLKISWRGKQYTSSFPQEECIMTHTIALKGVFDVIMIVIFHLINIIYNHKITLHLIDL